MNFDSAELVQSICYGMRTSDFFRSENRARIDDLNNGGSPWTEAQAEQNKVEINVSDLSHTRLTHDARLQLYQGFNKPGNFFTARSDYGPIHKRQSRGVIVTREINRRMKRSDDYNFTQRSQLAADIIHGIAPAAWPDSDHWCPDPLAVGDVLVPGRTLTSLKGLPFIALYRQYSPQTLMRLTRGTKRDQGWNMGAVNDVLKWVDEETKKGLTSSGNAADFWSPERMVERRKENDGAYASDLCPTVDCWDFYYWCDEDKQEGWRRKIVLDAEGGYKGWSNHKDKSRSGTNLTGRKASFLFDGGKRVWGTKLSEIVHFQFADLSGKSPFTYHSVRSLGWMLYAICHLQNRLNCKTWEAVFETLMQYFRVSSNDHERALKMSLVSRGIIDESVSFVRQEERCNPNAALVEVGHALGSRILNENSASWVQNQNHSRDKVEKTKFQVMAEINAMMTLVSAALQQAYRYQASQYREIVRRFMRPNSCDPDVRDFRACCLKSGVPATMLVADQWDVEPERIMGSGNKTLEMTIAQALMEARAAYSPEAQQKILRKFTLSMTDDAAEAYDLVPYAPVTTDTAHDAMVAFGSLMAGGTVRWKESHNRIEIAETLLGELATAIPAAMRDGEATMEQVEGFQNVIVHISEVIGEASKDDALKERVKQLAEASGKLSNAVEMLAKKAEAKAEEQNGDSRIPPEALAKIEATKMGAEAKMANTRESHAQRTAQKQFSHELQVKQAAEKHEQDLAAEAQRAALALETDARQKALDLSAQAASTAIDLKTQAAKAESAKAAPETPS